MKSKKINKKTIKQNKNIKESGNDSNEIKAFLIIVIIIAVLIGVIYGITELFKSEGLPEEKVTAGTVNYDRVSVGTMLNRPYNEYYVLVYNADDSKAVSYSTVLTKYMEKSDEKNYLKIYYCDLANALNKEFADKGNDGKSNPSAKTTEEFDFGDITLIRVKSGKVIKYIEDYSQIKELLK